MSNEDDFIVFVLDQIPDKSVLAKRMFGGHGLFLDGKMFALIADNQLYLKVDKQSLETFEEADCKPFQYQKNNKTFSMSYYLAPDSFFEDVEAAKYWFDLAFSSAQRSAVKKATKKASKRNKQP